MSLPQTFVISSAYLCAIQLHFVYPKIRGRELKRRLFKTQEEKFYEADEVEGKFIEVMLLDAEREEYPYWVDLSKIPEGEDEIDWSIEVAKKFHASKGLPEIPEDPEDPFEEPYATAYEPFLRYEGEFTFVE